MCRDRLHRSVHEESAYLLIEELVSTYAKTKFFCNRLHSNGGFTGI